MEGPLEGAASRGALPPPAGFPPGAISLPFEVLLDYSGVTVHVAADQTIVEAIESAGWKC